MTKIENERQYKASMERIEELLPLVTDNTPLTDKNLVELELLSNLVADYDEAHYPINTMIQGSSVCELSLFILFVNTNGLHL